MFKNEEYLHQLNSIVNDSKNLTNDLKSNLPENIKNVVLIGCGATLSQMYTLQYLLDQRSNSLNSRIINSGEAYTRKPNYIDSQSVVVLSSHSGTTTETVKSAEMAADKGAFIVTVTSNKDSKLASLSDAIFTYDPDGPAPSESKLLLLYLIGFSLIENNTNQDLFNEYKNWSKLPEVLLSVSEQVEDDSLKFAEEFKDSDTIYVLGSGPGYGAAYAFTICKLMEMQWKNGIPLKCGEFFHGPLEAIDENKPVILFKAEDKTRDICDRAHNFLKEYTNNLTVIDTEKFDLNGIDKNLRSIFSPIALWAAMNKYIDRLAKETGHDLDKRRYMGVVDY